MQKNAALATFGGGCFWCTEAIFKRLKGVENVVSGYSGGNAPSHSGLSSGSKTGEKNPSYEQVSRGTTGHAEAIQVTFNPSILSFEKLLTIFWATHNPTTMNQQGADKGTQYRSVIFYHDDQQKQTALKSKQTTQKDFQDPIVTEIVPFTAFYPAESYHQNYYDDNPSYPYCRLVIDPKIQKLLHTFNDDVKEEYK